MTPPRFRAARAAARRMAGLGMAALVLAAGPMAMAQAPPAAPQQSFAALAERLTPSVVNVSVKRDAPTPEIAPGSPLRRLAPAEGQAEQISASGSGFVVSPDGLVVTNNHVIEGARAIEVAFSDGERRVADLVGRDPVTDLAVLRVRGVRGLPAARWGDSDAARVGDWAIAIGNPFGLGGSLSVGVISARNRDLQTGRFDDFLQTDAAINRGNSGGPLFNAAGEVIGVTTAIVSPTGGSVGIGFAVPSQMARRVVDQLVRTGGVRRGWIGARLQPVTPEIAQSARLPAAAGALIAHLDRQGPAAVAGLREGDVIIAFAGRPVADSRALSRLVAETAPGARVPVQAVRDGARVSVLVSVALLDPGRGAPAPRSASATPAAVEAFGLSLAPLTAQDRTRARLPAERTGVIISSVDRSGPAAAALRPGDIVLAVQFTPVLSPPDARAQIERTRGQGRPVLFQIWRDGQATYRTVRARP
jgi:serine protease Do